MSDFSSFTGKFRAHKNGSQASLATKVTKSPRESTVCGACQRSKLRCDRRQPCSNCVRKNDSESCIYQRSNATKIETSQNAEDRLLHLESLVKELMQSRNGINPGPAANLALTQNSLDVGENPRNEQIGDANYVGFTHWSAILDDIHELKVALNGPSDPRTLGVSLGPTKVYQEMIFGSSDDSSLLQILTRYLPPKVEVDRLLAIYFRWESYIVPFIHTQHFQQQYRDFWLDTANINPLWLSMLFSICYAASLIGAVTDSCEPGGCSDFHTAAGKCLVLGEYHRPQEFVVESLALYGYCKNFGSLDPSREVGFILGIVVRLGYEMGYHREPDSIGKLTVFDGEMRRRCWSACKQMDLMISFQLGLPSNINLELCDIRSPRNLLDSDFDANTQVLPPSRPENGHTKLLWFIVKERQMVAFSKVCKVALSFKEISTADILQLDHEIREMWTTIPDILRTRPLSESLADAPFLIMTRLYVEFIYLKSLCVLHRKYMARGNVFSTKSCIEAAVRLVQQFLDMYKEFAPGGQLYMERGMLTNFTMNDFLLGVMVLCLVVHTRWKRGSENLDIDFSTEGEVISLLERSQMVCIEKSSSCRDARRVSQAIHLTLKAPRITEETQFAAPQSLINGEDQGLHSSSRQWYDEEVFGPLDPFNFMDVENIDWATFERDASFTERFSPK